MPDVSPVISRIKRVGIPHLARIRHDDLDPVFFELLKLPGKLGTVAVVDLVGDQVDLQTGEFLFPGD